ncbi:MAG: class I SAM-dependent methyltransferase [Candidatus Thiodiazotropha sp. (ex Dulcina madagascariensis)]|nr:class I SAM-dependent methyltransferase [Candidatus Thiodiazotropha sp. (ex Dulcina madagascariensis)]
MKTTEQIIRNCINQSGSRFDLWIHFLQTNDIRSMAEVGVYRGDFASRLLEKCNSIEKYHMIDPWRHLNDWNKPANKDDNIFEQFLSETKSKTNFAADKRILLQGKTTEVIDKIPDGELDFAYIDGDHTLKGITIDLIRLYAKIKVGGWIAGDDFSKTVWQHATTFEPTLVFPFAVYFAEAVGAKIYALPYSQFLIKKDDTQPFAFIDLTGKYGNIGLRDQFRLDKILKLKLTETFPFMRRVIRRAKQMASNLR